MMKRALIGIASVGILAVTVGVETANAQYYRRYDPAQNFYSQAYTPQSRGSVRREGVLRTTPFSDPNVRTQLPRHRVDHGTICGRSFANSGHYRYYAPVLIAPLSIQIRRAGVKKIRAPNAPVSRSDTRGR